MTSQGKGVSVEEAAKVLGKSSKTIRRYIAQGKLKAQREPKGQGFRYVVDIPEDTGRPGTQAAQVVSPIAQDLLAMIREKDAEIRRLHDQVDALTGTAAMYQEKASNLEARQKLLEAPKRQPWYKRILGQDRS